MGVTVTIADPDASARARRDRGRPFGDSRHETRGIHGRHPCVAGLPGELGFRHRVPVGVERLRRQLNTRAQCGQLGRARRHLHRGHSLHHRHHGGALRLTGVRRDRRRPFSDASHETRGIHGRRRRAAARPSHGGPGHHLSALVTHRRPQLNDRTQSGQLGRGRGYRDRRRTSGLWRRRRGGAVIAAAGPGQGYTRQHCGQPDDGSLTSHWISQRGHRGIAQHPPGAH